MTIKRNAVLLLVVQAALVLSIATKYAWERHHCPMVWTRTAAFDPDAPLRGRYFSTSLYINGCQLPSDGVLKRNGRSRPWSEWQRGNRVRLTAVSGVLTALPADDADNEAQNVSVPNEGRCELSVLNEPTEFFISEKAKSPFPLAKGTELWALVTVPPSGPPRPVQLAISGPDGFHPLDLR